MSTSSSRAATKMPTLRHVAERVGVSAMTVSVVLNGAKPGTVVADETRRKILEAANELGYKRNGAMVASRTGRFGNVALLLSTDSNRSTLPQGMWDAIFEELAAHNLSLSMARLADDELGNASAVPKILREWMVDGMLVDYTHRIPARLVELIHAHQMPAVWLNSQQGSDCVLPDDYAAGVAATRHLLGLGHRRLIYMDLSNHFEDASQHYSARARRQGFTDAMREAEREPVFIERGQLGSSLLHKEVARFLDCRPKPTAVVCYGNLEAELVLMAALRLGWNVPQQLSLLSFGAPNTWCVGYDVSMMTVPEAQMAREAVELLLQKIEHPERELPPLIIPFGFHAGQTCAPRSKK